MSVYLNRFIKPIYQKIDYESEINGLVVSNYQPVFRKFNQYPIVYLNDTKYTVTKRITIDGPYTDLSQVREIFEYTTNYWFTRQMIAKLGGSIIKGEKPVEIDAVVVKRSYQDRIFRNVKLYNLDQTKDVQLNVRRNFDKQDLYIKWIDKQIDKLNLIIKHQSNSPRITVSDCIDCYIAMPNIGQYKRPVDYYYTLFHEIGHALRFTGDPTNQNRLQWTDEDFTAWLSPEYAYEEIVAELVSMMLCEQFKILDDQIINQSTEYSVCWLFESLDKNDWYLPRIKKQLALCYQDAKKAVDKFNQLIGEN